MVDHPPSQGCAVLLEVRARARFSNLLPLIQRTVLVKVAPVSCRIAVSSRRAPLHSLPPEEAGIATTYLVSVPHIMRDPASRSHTTNFLPKTHRVPLLHTASHYSLVPCSSPNVVANTAPTLAVIARPDLRRRTCVQVRRRGS